MSQIDLEEQDFVEPRVAREEDVDVEVSAQTYQIRICFISHTFLGST